MASTGGFNVGKRGTSTGHARPGSTASPMPKETPTCRARQCRTRSTSSGTGSRPAPARPRRRWMSCRAAFVPGDRLHPMPDDVLVTEVDAGGVPAHWLAAPGTDAGRVLLFLHGGGFELGSVRSDGELAARLGRAGGMRVLFPEYRLAPEHHFPAAIDDVLAAWRWLRTDQGLSAQFNSGGRRLGRRRARRRPAGGRARRRGGIARGRRADVPDGGPDQLGGLDDRARRSGSDLHPRHAPPVRRRLPGRG